jgi:hypothetical protein
MDSQKAISQAKEAASRKDFTAAQKMLKQVLIQEPKNVEAWLALADVVQKPDIKTKCLEQVLKIDPDNDIARKQLMQSYQEVSELEKFKETLVPSEPQTIDDRLQSVSGLSAERDDPWENSSAASAELDDPWQVDPPPKTVSNPPDASATAVDEKTKQAARPAQKPAKRKGRWLEIALIGVLVVTACCVLGLFLIPNRNAVQGEQVSESGETAEENPMTVIIENIKASNAENVNYYMATIHSESPSYQSTKNMTKEAFSRFDLSYKVSGLKVVKQTEAEVVVAFILTTTKIHGPSFRDNRINGEMILRKEDGKWKIYDQVVHDVKYLN